jgi:NAD(P)-dependent dehydrogenase (short-subunit alcohol dehydrogenase family)
MTCLVTGASRGVGRGVAVSLALERGFTVFGTGRTIAAADLPSSVVRIPCDHTDDAQTSAAFEQAGDLDLLVNAAWGGYETVFADGAFAWNRPVWHNPAQRWASMMDAGVRAAYMCAAQAARGMAARGGGVIVNISYWAAQKYLGNTAYGIAKAATDKLTADLADELRPHNIAAVSLYPGLVRTEAIMAVAASLDLSNSESPEFTGRIVARLARDPELMRRSGQVLVAAALAKDYGIVDVDGRQPEPLTLQTA